MHLGFVQMLHRLPVSLPFHLCTWALFRCCTGYLYPCHFTCALGLCSDAAQVTCILAISPVHLGFAQMLHRLPISLPFHLCTWALFRCCTGYLYPCHFTCALGLCSDAAQVTCILAISPVHLGFVQMLHRLPISLPFHLCTWALLRCCTGYLYPCHFTCALGLCSDAAQVTCILAISPVHLGVERMKYEQEIDALHKSKERLM